MAIYRYVSLNVYVIQAKPCDTTYKSKQIHIGAAVLNTIEVQSANALNLLLQNSFKLKFLQEKGVLITKLTESI